MFLNPVESKEAFARENEIITFGMGYFPGAGGGGCAGILTALAIQPPS
jgi:hypothetical protein